MAGRSILLAAVGILAVGAGVLLQRHLSAGQKQRYPDTFADVVPGIKRLGYTWVNFGGLLSVDVHVYLIKRGSDYILMDASAPGGDERLLSAVDEATKDGKLRLVILTHGHVDHVGALPALVKAHPEMQILMHSAEAPYIAGTEEYFKADTIGLKLLKALVIKQVNVSSTLHPANTLLLQGESGDIAAALGPSGQLPRWAAPSGLVSFVRTPGHAEGHVSYVHTPSGSLLTGDAMANLGSPPTLSFPPPPFTRNSTQIRLDAKKLATLDIKRAFPSHDHGMGVSPADLQAFAAAD